MKNLTLRQYAHLPDTTLYDGMLEALKPANTFAGKKMDIQQMPYANVKYCIRLLGKTSGWPDVVKLFEVCYGCTEKQFWSVRIVEYFAARRFLINEFTRIIEAETRLLHTLSTDSHLWHMAGADRLKPFGDTLPLVQLGKMFGQYPFDLGRKPYGEIFSLLAQIKTQNEVEAEYSKLARN